MKEGSKNVFVCAVVSLFSLGYENSTFRILCFNVGTNNATNNQFHFSYMRYQVPGGTHIYIPKTNYMNQII